MLLVGGGAGGRDWLRLSRRRSAGDPSAQVRMSQYQ
ncbi:MAG: hypothetical protein QOJ69_429, partial [Actinomycetota bacterium]|nr:hypothetical protein [Actinomycetota bacterium]